MDTKKLKNGFTSWNSVDKLYSITGTILALCVNYQNQIEYSTFYVNGGKNILSKCWQYEFGLSPGFKQFNPHIFYWKQLEDINFSDIQWRDFTEKPDKTKQIIGWVNESDLIHERDPRTPDYITYQLTTLQTRLHFGYYSKRWYGKYLAYKGYSSVPWKKVFRWCYVDDLFINNTNEDARNLPISPSTSINYEFIQKHYS